MSSQRRPVCQVHVSLSAKTNSLEYDIYIYIPAPSSRCIIGYLLVPLVHRVLRPNEAILFRLSGAATTASMEHSAWLNSWKMFLNLPTPCKFEAGTIFRLSRSNCQRTGCWCFAACSYDVTMSLYSIAIFAGTEKGPCGPHIGGLEENEWMNSLCVYIYIYICI